MGVEKSKRKKNNGSEEIEYKGREVWNNVEMVEIMMKEKR
jgi:hypothetical protein